MRALNVRLHTKTKKQRRLSHISDIFFVMGKKSTVYNRGKRCYTTKKEKQGGKTLLKDIITPKKILFAPNAHTELRINFFAVSLPEKNSRSSSGVFVSLYYCRLVRESIS